MKLRVFVVDDEPKAVEFIVHFLKINFPSFEVCGTAPSIDDAFQKIRLVHPDLVFLDLNLPRGSGLELLERFPIRKFDVIVISAYAESHSGYEKFGISSIMDKPIDMDQMRANVQLVIERRLQNPGKVFML